jgi:hypothetical protein
VILAGSASDPWDLVHPGLVLGGMSETEMTAAVDALAANSAPPDWTDGQQYPIATVLATAADRRVALLLDGTDAVEDALTIDGDAPLGEHVFVLRGPVDSGAAGLQWMGLSFHPDLGATVDPGAAVLDRLHSTPAFQAALAERLHPGLMMVVSDLAAHPDRRTGADFVIMASDVVDIPPPPARPAGLPAVEPG